MSNTYFVSIRELLTSVLPEAGLVVPADSLLDEIKIQPAVLFPDPVYGMRCETAVMLGQKIETTLPVLDMISFSFGGSEDPIGLAFSIHPRKNVLIGPVPFSVHIKDDLFIPVKRAPEDHQNIAFVPDGDSSQLTINIDESWLSYDDEDGIGVGSGFVVTIPTFMIKGTNLILGAEHASLVLNEQQFRPALQDLGFDNGFRGIYAATATLYWLPEIQLNGFDLPGLRLDFQDIGIGNQGVSLNVTISWDVQFDAAGNFLEDDTEILGKLFDDHWQIALSSISGTIRRNIPEAFALTTFLRVPFFDAIFSASFSLAYRSEDDGTASYKTRIAIAKQSADPIVNSFYNDQLSLKINSFGASGWLSDQGFNISGQTGFEFDIFGFDLNVQSAELAYTHLENSDDFRFTMTNVQLGELGTAPQAKFILKAHTNENDETIFDQIEASATYTWQDLKGLIPQDMQDLLGIPEDGQIEALVSWKETDSQQSDSRHVEVRLLTEVSHLDNLWKFIPAGFRPEVRSLRSSFKITYDSSEEFNPKDPATGDSAPPPPTYTERSGVTVELSALMEVKLPDLANMNLPNFDLIQVETGDADGFVTAEFKASYESDSETGDSFQAGLTVQNAIAVDVALPGADPQSPFIENALTRVGLQFAYADSDEDEKEIGGKLLFEGDFTFRPLVPANIPFGDSFNTLMRNVGLDEISGRSKLSVGFTEDSFDFAIDGEFDDFGIEIDIFELISSLSTSNERPESEEFEIDFDVGFQLVGFSFKVGTSSDSDSDDGYYFEFKLKVECTMTALPPLKAAITLSNEEFSFGLEDLTIPLEIPRYPVDNDDLARLDGGGGIWSSAAKATFETELDGQIEQLNQQLIPADLSPRDQFRLLKDKAHLELKRLLLQLVMAVHKRVGPDGQPLFQSLIEVDTWIHATFLNFLHLDTELKLHFPEIKFRIPFEDPGGIAISGTGHIVGFAEDDPLKSLEDYLFTLGLSSEFIFCKIESTGDPIPIPGFGTKYDDGTISISKFMVGYGFTKNSFALDFAGEVVFPTELVNDADTSDELGVGVRLPRHNKLAFKIELIPVTIGKATVLVPVPRFDLDLRTPNAPALVSTARCEPYWDGLEFIIRDLIHADFKRLAFSPFFGFAIIPNIKFDGDIKLGDDSNGLTLIVDDLLVLAGAWAGGSYLIPIPFFADPLQPYFQNICGNLRVLGFEINFNMQRPFPSFSPLALFEVFGLVSDPMMEIDPRGSLANTIRFTLSDAYVRVPDFVLQMFPDAANFVNQSYGFTLNLGTLIVLSQSAIKAAKPAVDAVTGFVNDQSANLESAIQSVPDSFDPWDWIVMLPPELRKFRTGGEIAGFEASACLVIATGDEAREAMANKSAAKTDLPPLVMDNDNAQKTFATFSKQPNAILSPTNGHQFQTSWTQEGVSSGQWEKTDEGIAQLQNLNGITYFVHKKNTLPEDLGIRFQIRNALEHEPSAAGIVFCYVDANNHYVLRTLLVDESGRRVVVVERRKSGTITTLGDITIEKSDLTNVDLELTTYMNQGNRRFVVNRMTTVKPRGQQYDQVTFAEMLFDIQEDLAIRNGRVGLYAKNQSAMFTGMAIHKLNVDIASFGEIDQSVTGSGFNVNLKDSGLNDRRLINQDESTTLFKGLEFKKFDETHLDMIPVDRLEHASQSDASIYVGAYIKVFAGQRFRFLGRMFSDGSFALVSEAESKPLKLSVLGIPVHLPFSGYGNLIIAGRQKRNGYYGYIEANGYFDWSPIPNIVRFQVGDKDSLASLKLHSSGQFELTSSAAISLFNGAATVRGSVAISNQKAEFDGRLQFELGANIPGYRFTEIIALDINGAGSIEAFDRYRFRGRGEVRFLGETFTSIDVDVDEKFACFDVRLQKPASSKSVLESMYPILSSCDIDLRGSCKFRMQRTVRPEFRLAGEGHIKVLGAEIRGKGEVSSLPQKNQSLKQDAFHAKIEGNLLWQGRKWLGGKLSVGSTGLRVSGTTNIGLNLTPNQIANVKIASLFLNIQLDGDFRLNADQASLFFLFHGHWTLGAAMAGTGNPNSGNRQILPLASSEFAFSSNAGLPVNNQYCLQLFKIAGFAFLPFREFTIPLPKFSIAPKSDAKTIVKTGKTKYPYQDSNGDTKYNYEKAAEFHVAGAKIGVETGSLPGVYFNQDKSWDNDTVRRIYSGYDVKVEINELPANELSINFDELSNITLSCCLENNVAANFPLKLKLDSDGGTRYF